MKYYSITELEAALGCIGLRRGDVVMVQTSLMDLGLIRNFAPKELVPKVHGAIRDHVGSEGTICAQAFTFGSCKGEPFDPATTPSQGIGAFAEFLRRQPHSRRSPHPIQSIVANGPAADEICGTDAQSGYATEGPYGRLLALDAKLLLIGRTNVETASFGHYAEEVVGVPYRYWKQFRVTCRIRDHYETRIYDMYVRDLRTNPRLDLGPLCAEMETLGFFAIARVGASDIRLAQARSVTDHMIARLKKDRWAMVANREEILSAWGRSPHTTIGEAHRKIVEILTGVQPDRRDSINELPPEADLFDAGVLDSIILLQTVLEIERIAGRELNVENVELTSVTTIDGLARLLMAALNSELS
jgi:aminoglycoside 3-N-acetyltransferase